VCHPLGSVNKRICDCGGAILRSETDHASFIRKEALLGFCESICGLSQQHTLLVRFARQSGVDENSTTFVFCADELGSSADALNLPTEFLGHRSDVSLLRSDVLFWVFRESLRGCVYFVALDDSNSDFIADSEVSVLPPDVFLLRN
jgi:hypothetical protein